MLSSSHHCVNNKLHCTFRPNISPYSGAKINYYSQPKQKAPTETPPEAKALNATALKKLTA